MKDSAAHSAVAELSAPGKTFLIGEYLALDGGPSLLVSTSPRFALKAKPASAGGGHTFAPGSPAGRYFAKHAEAFRDVRFEFSDPHRGRGGLGASSAQFALLYAHHRGWRSTEQVQVDWREILTDYRDVAWNGEGAAPSGADVVSQLTGGLTWYDGKNARARRLEWRFPDLTFTLLRTGSKLATHEHLKRVKAAPHEALRQTVAQATNAIESGDENRLVTAVADAAEILAQAGLVAAGTESMLNELRRDASWVRTAKGCGAMGADVVLALHARDDVDSMRRWASGRGFEICGGEADLSEGLRTES